MGRVRWTVMSLLPANAKGDEHSKLTAEHQPVCLY